MYYGFPFLFLEPHTLLCKMGTLTPIWVECPPWQACSLPGHKVRIPLAENNWFVQLNLLCTNQMFTIGIMGTMFLSGYLFQQLYLHNAAEAINRKYILIFCNATVSILYVVLINSEYTLQFALSLFSLAILFSCQDHIGQHMIFD